MKSYEIVSNAKINMGLNVVGVLENGYHLLDMTMIPISLSDNLRVTIKNKEGNLKITSNKKEIPTDKSNILFKVYEAFYKKIDINPLDIEVYLEKNIPHEAGLGGGSSNGAEFLKTLNNYHNNILSEDELINIGKKIGADIPFFIINKPCRVGGIGEELSIIENNINSSLLIIKPKFGISTALAYKEIKNIKAPKMANIDLIIKSLKENNLKVLEENIENNLEEAMLSKSTDLQEFKKELQEYTNLKFFMSGSGSAYYAFLIKDIDEIFCNLKYRFKDCEVFICNFK